MYIVIRVEVWKLGLSLKKLGLSLKKLGFGSKKLGLSLKKLGFGPPQLRLGLGLVDHISGYVFWEFQPNIQVGWSYIHM